VVTGQLSNKKPGVWSVRRRLLVVQACEPSHRPHLRVYKPPAAVSPL